MLYVSHLVLYVYSYMSNVVNLYVWFSCMCIYCLYLCRRQKSLNHSAIHLTCLYMSSSCVIHVHVICCQLVCLLIMYVYCMYLSWRHGRTAPWLSCLSRLKNLIKKAMVYVMKYVMKNELSMHIVNLSYVLRSQGFYHVKTCVNTCRHRHGVWGMGVLFLRGWHLSSPC